ncbi:MAG: DUF2254 domain-containing protein [Bacteroidetes bacterium]|nr:DUF2254 domain-containing protein [Bacteroidota bacterium]HET6246045.1 DUF2254 domain-containing protein [Bacteroidia bacterium]
MEFNLKKKLIQLYYNIIQSLTFVPLTILIGYFILVIILIKLHDTEIGLESARAFPWIQVKSVALASEIITTLLTGMISLTVFSFSVVMIILSQAAQNFIPKILYKLKEDKFMHIVLGCYIGTITYYIVLLVNFGMEGEETIVPYIAFIVGVLLSIINIFLFVYFIHRTSLSIHARRITERLFNNTKEKLKEEKNKYKEDEETIRLNTTIQWKNYNSNSSGYLQSVDDGLVKFLAKRDLILKIHPVFGEYIVEKMLLLGLNKEVDKETLKEIESGLIFYSEERVEENSKYGFRQISEIAVKALSPGINNPGTAIFCIEYLTELYAILIKQNNSIYKRDKSGLVRIIAKDESFEDILFLSFSSIKNYGKKDIMIMEKLVKLLAKISPHDIDKKHQEYLNHLLVSVFDSVKENINDKIDLKKFYQTTEIICGRDDYFKEAIMGYSFTSLLI